MNFLKFFARAGCPQRGFWTYSAFSSWEPEWPTICNSTNRKCRPQRKENESFDNAQLFQTGCTFCKSAREWVSKLFCKVYCSILVQVSVFEYCVPYFNIISRKCYIFCYDTFPILTTWWNLKYIRSSSHILVIAIINENIKIMHYRTASSVGLIVNQR